MTKPGIGEGRIRQDEAILRAVVMHGVPVNVLAQAMNLTRQTIYRRMQRARVAIRLAAARAQREVDGQRAER